MGEVWIGYPGDDARPDARPWTGGLLIAGSDPVASAAAHPGRALAAAGPVDRLVFADAAACEEAVRATDLDWDGLDAASVTEVVVGSVTFALTDWLDRELWRWVVAVASPSTPSLRLHAVPTQRGQSRTPTVGTSPDSA